MQSAAGLGVRLWDLEAETAAARWNAARGAIVGFSVSDSGSIIACDREAFSVVRVNDSRRADHPVLGPVTIMSASANARWLLTTMPRPLSGGLWDVASGRRLAEIPLGAGSRAATFADGDRRIVIGLGNGEVRTWEWLEGTLANPRTFTPHNSEVLAFVSTGTTLFVAHREHFVVQLDLATGRELRRIRATASPFSLALSPDGRQLAIGTYSGVIELWDAVTGEKRGDLKGQTSLIHRVDFSPDGTLIATSSRDGTTRLWTRDGQFLATIAARTAPALNLSFFPDRRRLAIGYADGELEARDLNYFFRHAAGQAEYQLRLRRQAGEAFPREHEALAWSRRVLSGR